MLGAGGAADNQDRLQTELEQYESSLQGGNFTTVKNSEDALLLVSAAEATQDAHIGPQGPPKQSQDH